MNYEDAILWVTDEDGMSHRTSWMNEDISFFDESKTEHYIPKAIFLDIDAELVLQVGDTVTPYVPSEEDTKATDWERI